MPINNGNARMHWAAKHRQHTAWKLEAVVKERGLRGRPECFTHARIRAVFYVGRNPRWVMDVDNLFSRMKWVLDLLTERGLIVDDSAAHVTLETPKQRQEVPRRVELTLTEVAA